nr:TrbI/VirB10 family protein [Sphingopyxis panaciterrulae]
MVLRGTPRRVARFRREIIIGVAATGALAIAIVTWVALEPASFRLAANGGEMFEKGPGKAPEALAGAPGRYDEIPKLGPPLPGDLGRPILEHRRKLDGQYPSPDAKGDAAAAAEAERERRIAEVAAARQSAVMMSLGSTRPTTPAAVEARAVAAGPEEAASALPSRASGTAGSANVSPHRIEAAASPWLVTSGSVIAASLVTGLNSELPGIVIAQVSENVFDSVTGRTLLIPQGARLIGRYESNTSYSQQRAFVIWQRIIWPDGSSLTLEDAPASDPSGYAGIRDRIDAHGWQLIKGVALSTLLGVGTELGTGNGESELVRAMREAAQQSGARAGDRLVERGLEIRPTMVVRPGWPVRVLVHRDLVLAPWRG